MVTHYTTNRDEFCFSGSGMVTLEGGDNCIPLTFAYHDDSSSDYARYVTLLITNFEFFLVRSSGLIGIKQYFAYPWYGRKLWNRNLNKRQPQSGCSHVLSTLPNSHTDK